MYDYIIVANGEFLVREIITEACKNKVIVALDGAAIKLKRLGIKPHIIIGDFDSIKESNSNTWGIKQTLEELQDDAAPYMGNDDIAIVPSKNQNFTDLVKAIRYCDQQIAKSITIICAVGGRIDHDEGVKRSLRTEYKRGRPIFLHTEQQTVKFAMDETIEIHGEPGDYCGIVSYPAGSFSSKGLLYNGENYALEFGFSESISNALQEKIAKVDLIGEALIIMPPQLSSQREYMSKSEVERMQLKLRDMN